jgi:hypothetical protein
MATHDYDIANQSGAAFRTDLNNALAAIQSNNSNSSSPANTVAYQWWADTTTGTLKIRNSANDGWIELFQLDGTLTLEDGSNSAPALAFRDDLDTGIFSGGANEFNITTGGVERLEIGGGSFTVNPTGADFNFFVEGDTDQYLLTVDAGLEKVGIGIQTPARKLHVTDSDAEVLKLSTTATGAQGATIELQHNSASPADDDFIGVIHSSANDSAGNDTLMSTLRTQFTDVTDGTETAAFSVALRGQNSFNETFRVIGRGSASAPNLANADTNGLIVDVYNDGNPYPRHVILCAKGGGDTDSDLQFWTEAVGGAPTKKMVVEHDGNVTITDGNLIVASGHGIDFSATTDDPQGGADDSELFDDYERGTWTPVLGATSSDPSVSSYSSQHGQYTKIGNVVHLFCYMDIAAGGITAAGSGDGLIRGLPFAIDSSPGSSDSHGSAVDNIKSIPNTFSSQRNNARLFFAVGEDIIRLHQYSSINPIYQTGWGSSQIANGDRFKWGWVATYETHQ